MITLTSNIQRAFNHGSPLVWLVKVSLDDETRYWSSDHVTISGQEYVGRFIVDQSMDNVQQSVDISLGGNVGAVGNTGITLKEIVDENGLHQSFKPHSSGTELLYREFEFGCVYDDGGTLSSSDVVWLYKGLIDDFEISLEGIDLTIVGAREVEAIELPSISINSNQHPNAPEEAMGSPIPILYGDFIGDNGDWDVYDVTDYTRACPMVCVDKSGVFYGSSHPCHTAGDPHYHDGSMNDFSYAVVKTSGFPAYIAAPALPDGGEGFSTVNITSGRFIARHIAMLVVAGENNDVTNYQNVVDRDFTNSADVANTEKLSMILAGYPNGLIDTDVRIGWSRLVTTSQSWAIGYALDGTYADIQTYSSETGTDNVDVSTLLGGESTSNLAKYEWLVDCSGVGESVSSLNKFFLAVDVFVDENVIKPITNMRTGRILTTGTTVTTSAAKVTVRLVYR